MAAAVTSWASTWRIFQFKPIGTSTMGAYRECRAACLRHISLADSFDERIEAVREAASAGNFAAYMAGQGGANVPRDVQTVCLACKVADEPSAYYEEVQKVVGFFAPHLGVLSDPREPEPDMQVAIPEYVTAVMNLIESGDVRWNDTDVAKTLRNVLRQQSPKDNHQEITRDRRKSRNDAPSDSDTS